MLGYTTLLWALSAGICLYASVLHLQMGLRQPFDRVHLVFGLLALTAALAIFGNTQLVTAQTPERYQRVIWFSSVAVTTLYGLIPWFVTLYANEARRSAAMFVSALYAIVLIGNFFQPYSMLLSGPPELGQVTYAWGESITRAKTPPAAWAQMLWLSHVFLIGYLAYVCANLFRRGPRTRAWGLLAATAPFVVSLTLNLLVHFGAVNIPYTAAFGFLAMVVVMSAALTSEWRSISRRMQIVMDNVPAAVYLKNADGRYQFVNRLFEELSDLNAASILGKTDDELFKSERAILRQQSEHKVMRTGRTLQSEFSVEVRGEIKTFAAVTFALRNDDNGPYAVCGIATDISERKASADALRELTVNLERRVARRTLDLAEVNRELEAFAYSVSHDLRAPLMTVHGFADLLLRDFAPNLDQTAQKYVHRIRDGAKRMTGLIEDLLSLSRVTREIPQRTRCNLSALAHDALRVLHEAEPARQVTVEIAADMSLQADPRLMAVVMSNLLSNAWKYTGKRSDARIDVGMLEQEGETVFFVRDNGAGFDTKYVDRLFQPFKRLHSEQEFPGHGIGLATVARIIHRHGGRVWAEGKPHEGATFYFTVPVPEEDTPADTSHGQESLTA
jgi:PAS domain S-box-containing protein